ncbi:MAG: DUF378 domain-containing protein [Oscillospiraceae bacterium]|nr:DUF378 domain-containing protein [Oscillospiraceae bacterium]
MLKRLSLILLVVGGLNWGSVGLFSFDAVAWLCGGAASIFARIIFTLVGIAAIIAVFTAFGDGKEDTFPPQQPQRE